MGMNVAEPSASGGAMDRAMIFGVVKMDQAGGKNDG